MQTLTGVGAKRNLHQSDSSGVDFTIRAVSANSFTLSRISGVFADAFSEYPLIRWALTEQREHSEIRFQLFRFLLDDFGFPFGTAYLTDHDLGAAIWMRSEDLRQPSSEECQRVTDRIEALLGPQSTKKLLSINRAMQRYHLRDPHLYLYLIGVRKHIQRHGVGSKLLTAGLEMADKAGIPAFLETSSESAAEFYRRFGFNVIDKYYVSKGSPATWTMLRKPSR